MFYGYETSVYSRTEVIERMMYEAVHLNNTDDIDNILLRVTYAVFQILDLSVDVNRYNASILTSDFYRV